MSGPHVEEVQALVWRGGGRRFFSRKAAVKHAAKTIVRKQIHGQGEDSLPIEQYWAAVTQVIGQIERGETPEVDWDALPPPGPPLFDEPYDADLGGA